MMPDQLISRREFLATSAAATAGTAALLAGCAHASGTRGGAHEGDDRGGTASPYRVYVGTYTENGRTEGVYRFRVEADTGLWRADGAAVAGPNPSFLALRPDGRTLYAVNEVEDYEGRPSGAVSALALEPATGALTLRDRRATRGGDPCYVSVDRTGRYALVANYAAGSVAVFPAGADGALGEPTAVVQHQGSGPNTERQQGPHAHCVIPDPSNHFALASDLGVDRVFVYRLDDRAGTLTPAAVPSVALRPGAGPRHLAFHPSGRFLYVIAELDSTLNVFAWDAGTGALTPLQTVPVLSAPPAVTSLAADVHVAPSGRFLYASVRGDNSIVVFAIDPDTGRLTPVERVSTGGDWPRNFTLDPAGRFLFVANQRSGNIVGFRVDPASGRLTPNGARVEVPAPVCIRFAGPVVG